MKRAAIEEFRGLGLKIFERETRFLKYAVQEALGQVAGMDGHDRAKNSSVRMGREGLALGTTARGLRLGIGIV